MQIEWLFRYRLESGWVVQLPFILLKVIRIQLLYNAVNNQHDATTFSCINLFNSALHVSGEKFAYPQEHFLTIYSFWYNAATLLPTGATVEMELIFLIQPYMFRAKNSPILRSTFDYIQLLLQCSDTAADRCHGWDGTNLFNLSLHVSSDKFAHSQEHFLTVYTAFGTMRRHCCRPVPRLRWN